MKHTARTLAYIKSLASRYTVTLFGGSNMDENFIPVYILIQDNIVLDAKESPVTLNYGKTHPQSDIIVAIGVINEFRVKEIIGVCGRYMYRPLACAWALQFDNNKPTFTKVNANPGKLLRDCLYQLKKRGLLSDVLNFATVTITAVLEEMVDIEDGELCLA